ncbi:MAG: restriction endonuclease, partial [Acetobacteraceae bacterium]|nr:restriction endonuclease [Acetobacteraceae bacterium]
MPPRMRKPANRQPANKGVEFEHQVAQRLTNLGWKVELTPACGDCGADVIAWIGTNSNATREKIVVQCKDWGSPVGFDAIKEVYAAKTLFRAGFAIVVSRSGFTRQAQMVACCGRPTRAIPCPEAGRPAKARASKRTLNRRRTVRVLFAQGHASSRKCPALAPDRPVC